MIRAKTPLAALAVALVAAAAPAFAAPVEFADFNTPNAQQPFSFTNNGGTSGSLGYNSAVKVNFNFTTATGLSTADRTATVTLTGTTFTPASPAGSFIDQPISGPASLKITEDATGKNLLTMLFTGDILGRNGGTNASLSGADTTGQTVTYTSDYLAFTQPGNSYNLSLATLVPALSIGPGGFLNSFIANINGQFTANITTLGTVPAPTSVAMLGTGALVPVGLLVARRKKRAKAVQV